jgi:hypothetical protein
MAQFELFNTAPPVSAAPSADEVRARLEAIFATLRSGDKVAEGEIRRLKVVVPQMARWLPSEEAEAMRAQFAAEIARLDRAA